MSPEQWVDKVLPWLLCGNEIEQGMGGSTDQSKSYSEWLGLA